MAKLFIERLTDEQVRTFLEREYPKKEKYSYSFDRYEGCIYVRIDQNMGDCLFNISLCEYDTIGYSRTSRWIKYLYEVFGEEYKKSYLDRCAKIFN